MLIDCCLLDGTAMAPYWRVCEVLTFAAIWVLADKLESGIRQRASISETGGTQDQLGEKV